MEVWNIRSRASDGNLNQVKTVKAAGLLQTSLSLYIIINNVKESELSIRPSSPVHLLNNSVLLHLWK